MSTLTVTAQGQVTLRRDLLQHLGVQPGDKITVDMIPDGRIEVRAARPACPCPRYRRRRRTAKQDGASAAGRRRHGGAFHSGSCDRNAVKLIAAQGRAHGLLS
jgi:bifunctional DNA-binding transcriptional regulator/antitoxin component of YhaV-PrlF toxin-antitoxin module